MVSIVLPFSPRTRGCSSDAAKTEAEAAVFPAHAGMFLRSDKKIAQLQGFPRARGDVPYSYMQLRATISVFPAHAGMFPVACERDTPLSGFPRARGDVPIL